MITPTLRDLYSDDFDASQWLPDAGVPIDYWLVLEIGPDNEEGTDYFTARVAEPAALLQNGASVNRAVVLVDRSRYSFPTIRSAIEATVATCVRASWHDSALALSRHFHWEYEDYSVAKESD